MKPLGAKPLEARGEPASRKYNAKFEKYKTFLMGLK